MSGCTSLITTERISLFYAEDPDPSADIPDTFTWHSFLMTGESIEPKLSSTILADITPERAYSDSTLAGGELAGGVNFYLRSHEQFYNMLLSVMQADRGLSWVGSVVDTTSVSISAPGLTDSVARTIEMSGLTPVDGATYSVQIDGTDFQFLAGTGATVASIATGLASAIDASTAYAASPAVTGASGVVISAAGAAAGDDRTITLTGLAVVPGATYTLTVGSTAFAYEVQAADTLALVATGLAALVDADMTLQATATGAVITIADGAGLLAITFSTSPVVTITSGAGRKAIQFAVWPPAVWAPGETIKNLSSRKCLAFLKRVEISEGIYDWYAFRGMQVSTVTIEVKSKTPITGSCTLMGLRPDAPVTASALPAGWTFVPADVTPAMSGSNGLEGFEVQSSNGLDSGAIISDVTITIDNQMRLQDGVGLGHIYAAGVAAGKIKVTASATVYYASPRVYEDLLNDNSLRIVGSLVDTNGDGIGFVMNKVKVTGGGIPLADSEGKDATVKTDFQAFEDAATGTISLTRLAG